jgi:hypothetical protein
MKKLKKSVPLTFPVKNSNQTNVSEYAACLNSDFEKLFIKYDSEVVNGLRGDLVSNAENYRDQLQAIVFNNYEKFIESSR